MDRIALKSFITVAELKSFSLAADALFITQPAISKRIKLLEQQLDCKLLNRGAKNMSLTQAGIALLPRAKKIVQDMDECTQLMSDLTGRTMGSLTLATSHHIGLHRLPPILQQFVQQHPNVDIDIKFMDSETACHAVDNNEMEVAIVTLPNKQWNNLTTDTIWTDDLKIIVNHQHPLASNSTTSIHELLMHPAILPSKGTFTRNIIENTIKELNTSLTVSMETNYLETIKMLVSVGLGWSILPKNMVSEQTNLHIVNVDGFSAYRQLGTVINKQRSISNPTAALINLIQTHKAESSHTT